jgi:ATP-dependent DNA helicase RecG
MNLFAPVEKIPRVGPAFQKKLKRLGIKTVRDLLYHFPHRYEDFSNLIPISHIQEGGPASALASAGKPFCFQGEILDVKNIRTFRRKMMLTQLVLGDETGKLKALWFNQPYLLNNFKKGEYLCLAGKISGKGSAKYLSSPVYEKIPDLRFQVSDLSHTGRLIPVYPETEGLSSKWLRFIVKPVLTEIGGEISDPLPEKIINNYGFLPIRQAIWQIHFPDSLKLAEESKKRFAFEELFLLSLFVQRERLKLAKEKATPLPINLKVVKEFTQSLPFKLTDAQRKSAWQILRDMGKPRPMNRLLEGDVGSGKTVVAAMAVLNTAEAGHQVAFMAPTEILAKQHSKTMRWLLEKFGLKIGLITGKENYLRNRKITRKELLEKVENGGVDVLVGTHAIIQGGTPKTELKTSVRFNSLALVIIDEQHRFGVEQRAKLAAGGKKQKKTAIPHLLSMTATPIPRTLSLTIYGDLDLSLIDELPRGRKKIITKIVQPKDKKAAYEFVRQQVKEGRQVFVICPRIEPRTRAEFGTGQARQEELSLQSLSWMEVKAVKEEYQKLSKEIFPDLKTDMLHGKMKSQEKEKAMKKFKEGKTDVLVSTSVVEVGVDIPNAAVMIIEGSEKFGLAQLHQFRGRVGRSEHQSYCFLFTEKPGLNINRRLRALISCENGFELAEKDLLIRGPGAINGQRQWGIPDLTMSSLMDISLVEKTRNEAKEVLQEDPSLKKYPSLRERLERFKERIHFE